MPARDKQGPLGEGPMTGRGMGACNDGTSRRAGCRRPGFGRGINYVSNEETSDFDDINALKARIAKLEEKLNTM